MKQFFLTALFALFLLPLSSLHAAEQPLAIDLAEDHVDITTGFSGAKLILFGVKEEPGDLVVVLRGPSAPTVVRRKEQIAGVWLNRRSVVFEDVPRYYDYAVAKSEKNLAPLSLLRKLDIGLNALSFTPEDETEKEEYISKFQEALIRNRQTSGHFPLQPKKISFINDNFFRTTLALPANVPIGEYKLETYLFRKGVLLDRKTTTLKVAQIGASAKIYDFAHEHAFLYGILAIFMAVLAGWGANAVMQKD